MTRPFTTSCSVAPDSTFSELVQCFFILLSLKPPLNFSCVWNMINVMKYFKYLNFFCSWAPDLSLRTSVWTQVLAGGLAYLVRANSQPAVMRYRSVGSEQCATRWVFVNYDSILNNCERVAYAKKLLVRHNNLQMTKGLTVLEKKKAHKLAGRAKCKLIPCLQSPVYRNSRHISFPVFGVFCWRRRVCLLLAPRLWTLGKRGSLFIKPGICTMERAKDCKACLREKCTGIQASDREISDKFCSKCYYTRDSQ